MSQATPIPTTYGGCRFRSRLEARWAVFFDAMSIEWQYEPEGFEFTRGRRYLPDFLLPGCGTWIEVKGHEAALNRGLMLIAARELPHVEEQPGHEHGPNLMVLGPMPRPTQEGDWGWIGLNGDESLIRLIDPATIWRHGFGDYNNNGRPSWFDNGSSDQWLTPSYDPYERNAQAAYGAARSAQFEFGKTPHVALARLRQVGRPRE